MTTPVLRAKGGKSLGLLALLTSFFVAFSGLLVAPAAYAAPVATPVVTASEAPREGGTITVHGSGFDATNEVGVYIGLAPAGFPGFYLASSQILDTVLVTPGSAEQQTVDGRTEPLQADGTFTTTFTIPTWAEGDNYALYTSKAHGQGFADTSQNSISPVTYSAPAPVPATLTTTTLTASATTVEAGRSVDLTASVTPADAPGTVTFMQGEQQLGEAVAVTKGKATIATDALMEGTHNFIAQFAPGDGVNFTDSTSSGVNVVGTAPAAPEEIPVEKPVGKPEEGLEESSPITDIEGAAFTWAFKESWNTYLNSPWTQGKTIVSDGATLGEEGVIGFASSTNDYDATTGLGTITYAGTVRYVSDLHGFDMAMANPRVEFTADDARITAEVSDSDVAGTSSTTRIVVAELGNTLSSDAQGVRSWTDLETTLATPLQPTGWERYAGQAGAPASFSVALAAEWTPAIAVYEADGVTRLDPSTALYDGDTIVVRGTGFDPEANIGGQGRPIPKTLPQGSYVVFGNFAENWKPSAGAEPSERVSGAQAWVLPANVLDQIPTDFRGSNPQEAVRAQWAELSADGTFEATLKLAPLTNRDGNPAELPDRGSYGVYTYAAGGTVNAAQELNFALNYRGEKPADTEEPAPKPKPKPKPEVPAKPAPEVAGGLSWSFKFSWNFYLDNFAAGARTTSGGATLGEGGIVNYVPAPGSTYDPDTGQGTVKYAGMVMYSSDIHGFEIAVSDPWVEFTKDGAVLTASVSTDDTAGASSMKRIRMATLADPQSVTQDGVLHWKAVKGTFHEQLQPESWDQYAGQATDPVTFSFDPEAAPEAPTPSEPATPKPKPQPKPQPKPTPATPATTTQAAGSLTWGVSTAFAQYVTGNVAKGGVITNGVGGGAGAYVFPQATGGSWNADTHTGTIRYSGVVTFSGHHGQLNESVTNPVITVTSDANATLSAGGRTFGLNLGAASKTVGAGGEVTWSGVPVSGGFAFGSHNLAADRLSFTVGAPSGATHGSSSAGTPQQSRSVPDTPPASTGITMITDAEKIRPGATIEIEASGFQADEWGIMTVLYSEPTVLDAEATADKNGVVRWIGTLPDDLEPGTHTITLQGSISVGTEIEVLDPAAEELTLEVTSAEALEQDVQTTSADVGTETQAGFGGTGLWIGAAVLLLLAAGGVALVVAQRRRAATV